MRIDVHNHAIPEAVLELLASDHAYGVTLRGRRWTGGKHVDFVVADAFVDAGAKLAELEARGLDAAVVSVAPPLFYYHVAPDAGERMARTANEGLAELCAQEPDRLRWLASVPMQDPQRAAATLADAVEQGCVGVEIGTSIDGARLDEPRFEPFWEEADRLGLPVTLHPAYSEGINAALAPYYLENVLGFPFDTTIAIERLLCAGVLDRHARLSLVLLHGGGFFPYQAGRLAHAATVRPELEDSPGDPWGYLDRLHFDPITHDVEALRYLVDRVGAQRVVMGTDLPFDMASAQPWEALVEAVGPDVAGRIAQDNPAALYGLDSVG